MNIMSRRKSGAAGMNQPNQNDIALMIRTNRNKMAAGSSDLQASNTEDST